MTFFFFLVTVLYVVVYSKFDKVSIGPRTILGDGTFQFWVELPFFFDDGIFKKRVLASNGTFELGY